MGTTAELLRAAKGYVTKGRSVGSAARNQDDVVVDPTSDDATSFSVYGALTRAAYDLRSSDGFDHALLLLGIGNLQDPYGDGLTKSLSEEQLDKRFEDAIARAEGGPVTERSAEAEIRMLDPRDEDFTQKAAAIRAEVQGKEPPPAPEPVPEEPEAPEGGDDGQAAST